MPSSPIRSCTAHAAARQRGMTLIELMVAMVIALLLALAMVSALVFGEAQRRTTSATSDMDQSGAYAASLLDTALRNAGSGLVQTPSLIGCNPGFTGALPIPFDKFLDGQMANLRVAPVLIAANPSETMPASDVLMVMSGSGAAGSIPRTVVSASGSMLTLSNTVGIIPDPSTIGRDKPQVLIDQPGSSNCALLTVMGGSIDPPTLTLNQSLTINPTQVLPLGNLGASDVQFQLFGVDPATGTLSSYDLLAQKLQPLAGNVLAMQALYGIADGSGRLTKWVAPTSADGYDITTLLNTPSEFNQIVAIRVALILKGNLLEKDAINTQNTLTWFKPASGNADLAGIPFAADAMNQTWPLSGDAARYRYRVLEFVVPVRNSLLPNPNS
jgi:type IV pilus assembly protein PilW